MRAGSRKNEGVSEMRMQRHLYGSIEGLTARRRTGFCLSSTGGRVVDDMNAKSLVPQSCHSFWRRFVGRILCATSVSERVDLDIRWEKRNRSHGGRLKVRDGS
jgi:hypothetical protein